MPRTENMIPEVVRFAENEIDKSVGELPFWRVSRDDLVLALLDLYRGSIENAFLEVGRQQLIAKHLGPEKADLGPALHFESRLHIGMLWALKWAYSRCPEFGTRPPIGEELLDLIWTGASYQVLADALWMHKEGWGRIDVDPAQKLIRVYEGGDKTGRDRDLAEYLHGTLALHRHQSFTNDADSLTSQWAAGDWRTLGRKLMSVCADGCTETVQFHGTEPPTTLFTRPAILEVPEDVIAERAALIEDLTLSRESLLKMGGVWRFNSWFDRPMVKVGGRVLFASNVIQAVFAESVDDHMLRVAAGVDAKQYNRVSQQREARMTAFCVDQLRAAGWDCAAPFPLTDPPADVDIYATRQESKLILELKSTLRPESPREVASRNG